MIGNKFYTNISSLDKNELNGFIRYSKSTFLNKRPEILKTLEQYKQNPKHFENMLSNDTLMFKKLISEKDKFDKKQLKNHFHYCEKLFENFVVFNYSQNNKEARLSILTDFYAEKNITSEALLVNSTLITLIESYKLNYKNNRKLFKHHLKRFDILLNDFSYDTFKYAEKALQYLDKYYFLEKFNLRQELYSDSIMTNRAYDFKLLDEIKKEIKGDKEFSSNLLFKIFSITIELYERKVDIDTYFVFKKLIINNIHLFDNNSIKYFLGDI